MLMMVRRHAKGILIGAGLSAPLICLCLLCIEYRFVEDEHCHKTVNPTLSDWLYALPYPSFQCGESLMFPFVAFIPHNKDHFHTEGMDGFLAPRKAFVYLPVRLKK